jgi:hypothetical protein
MSFPLNPANGAKATINGIKYIYSNVTNSWRRDFNNVLDRLFLVGGNQADFNSTSTGDLVVTGGGRFGKNLIVGGDLIVSGTSTTFTSVLVGTISTATLALNLQGGARGSLVYQSTVSTTAFIPIATTGSILMSNGVIPIWTASAAINVAIATSATNLAGGSIYQIPFQSGTGLTTFSANLTYNNSTLSVKNTTTSIDTTTGALVIAGGMGIGGDVFIGGSLQIAGTSTYINTVNLEVTDKNITIAKGSINAAAANGAGITIEGPANRPQLYYASADDSWNFNKQLNLTPTTAAVSTQTGALRVYGGVGIGGDLFAGSLRGPLTGTVGAGTKNSGGFTTIVATSAAVSTSTNTGALQVAGGVGIGGDLYVGGQIVGTILSTQYATTATTAGFANTASLAYTSLVSNLASVATNIAGGLNTRIPYQSATSSTTFSANLTFDGTNFQTSRITVSQADPSTLPVGSYGLILSNSGNNQSPILKLTGNSSGFAMISSFGTLRIMQDATTLTNTLLSISSTLVNITPTTVSTNTTNGALVVAGGVGIAGNLNVGSNSTFNGNVLPTNDVTYNLGSPTAKWKSLYISSSTIYLGNSAISATGIGLEINGKPLVSTSVISFTGVSVVYSSGTLLFDRSGASYDVWMHARFLCPTKVITLKNALREDTFTLTSNPVFINSGTAYSITCELGNDNGITYTEIDMPMDPPISSHAPGIPGQIAYDNTWTYVCVTDDTWHRLTATRTW